LFSTLLQRPGRSILVAPPVANRAKDRQMPTTLDKMQKGSKGKVVSVAGGRGVILKLSAQGIAPGMVVKKVGHLRGGPVLLQVGRCQIAVGLGLARRVFVEVVNS
jgi:ferrous iron transport protein A